MQGNNDSGNPDMDAPPGDIDPAKAMPAAALPTSDSIGAEDMPAPDAEGGGWDAEALPENSEFSEPSELSNDFGGEDALTEPEEGFAEPSPVDLRAVADMISEEMNTQIGVPLTDLNTAISARMRRDDQLFSMQKELEKHRADLILKMMRPFVNALITAHDNMTMRRDSFEKSEDEHIEKLRVMKTLDGFLEDIELTLSENGIDCFSQDNHDEKFSGAHQKVVGYVTAQNEEQHGLVAKIVRPGFSYDDQILQKQRVKVFKYSKAAADDAADDNKDQL